MYMCVYSIEYEFGSLTEFGQSTPIRFFVTDYSFAFRISTKFGNSVFRPISAIRLFSAFRPISTSRHSSRLFGRLPRKEGRLYTTNSPFTPVGGEPTKPILFRHATSFSIGKIFVSMSEPFSSVGILDRTNSFSSTLSLNQWYLL